MPTTDRPDPRTTLTARTVRRRSGPVHVITTLPAVRTPVIARAAVPDWPRGWTVRVTDGPIHICTYPPMPLWSAWALARSARRCWPNWQTHLTRARDADRGRDRG
ncbi:MAG: hypothetical protein QOC93_182 [Actinomycetota bacterium]|jgi:hypothetical protein|nr:hypothetical protein [Actinomycetota bacterium]